MKKYYLTNMSEGDTEQIVHDEFCRKLPVFENRLFLGEYASCSEAVAAGKKHYDRVTGCVICSPACRPLYFK